MHTSKPTSQQTAIANAMDQAGYSPQYIDHQLAAIPALEHIHHSLAEPSKVNYAVLAGCLAQAGQLA